ncbi:MAG: DUF7004 family protein [Halothece sp.]
MSQTIKQFPDGSILEYDTGSFDNWCIFLTRPNQTRYAPKDVQYFRQLQQLSKQHTAREIYDDFVKIYNQTGTTIQAHVLDAIEKYSANYGNDALEINILFTILYAGMVAEENKMHTKLGKRIKRLGMYQILLEDILAQQAANYSRGKSWRKIACECTNRGF